MRAGVAVRDVTPRVGAAMSGFAARTAGATGVHDALSVRALVVDDTAVITVDVIGLHEDDCARVRAACPLPDERVVVHATHTHGGPVSMPGRLGGTPSALDTGWLDGVVAACADAVREALASARPVTLRTGEATGLGVARNRRRPGGAVDDRMPVLLFSDADGAPVAALVSYACHPVVLGADNTELTADYPGVVRRLLGERIGAPVLFLTGCAGDANTGHVAEASYSTEASTGRTFGACEEVGLVLADAASEVLADFRRGPAPTPPETGRGRTAEPAVAAPQSATIATREVVLDVVVPTAEGVRAEVACWRSRLDGADTPDAGEAALLRTWIAWGTALLVDLEGGTGAAASTWHGRVSVLRWGDVTLVTLPGEPFAVAAERVREALADASGGSAAGVVVVAGYTDGCPGYLPDAEEIPLGGYEVTDAHRYYGLPGPFAPGSLERVLAAATSAGLAPG